MKAAAALLLRYNDYASFCKSPANYRTTICNVTTAAIVLQINPATAFRFRIFRQSVFLSKDDTCHCR